MVDAAASGLRVRLLGGFDLRYGGEPVALGESARARSLLAFLLLHREIAHSRQRLAFLLWPDSSEAQARTNLRHLLHNLRRTLPDADRFIEVTAHSLSWRRAAPVWVDLVAFEECLERAGRDPSGRVEALREAVELYRGDLVTGAYDEWLLAAREELRQRYLAALDQLSGLLAGRGQLEPAIQFAERLVREDPLEEKGYRQLMRLHAAAGDRGRAVRVYHACASALERELGVEPSAATVKAYEEVLAAGPVEAAERPGRVSGAALVGRGAESARLAAAWREARQDGPRLVLVTGEPGIGKTRLVDQLAERAAHEGARVAVARSYAAEGALAYGLVVAWLTSDAVRPALSGLAPADAAELALLLPELAPAADARAPVSAGEQRRRLFAAASRALLAAGSPLLLVADDLHWGDEESIQLIHYLVRGAPAGLLVAATARREELADQPALEQLRAGLAAIERLREVALERLTRDETAALGAHLAGRALAAGGADRLYRLSEGNPLFIVETLRAGWDQAGAPGEGLTPRLQAVIRARLAQLSPPARELAGVAAAIGRAFSAEVLAGACDLDDQRFVGALDELWRRGVVRHREVDIYDFSHDRIREVAHADLGPARRRRHHLRIAETLLAAHGPAAAGVQGQVAAHLEQAGRLEDAAGWYVNASQAARAVHAYREAVRLLERAADALRRLPGGGRRLVDVLAAIPAHISVVEGFTAPALIAAQEGALEAARAARVEPPPPLVRSLAMTSLTRGDFAGALSSAATLLVGGEREADEAMIVEGNYLLGVGAFWRGELDAARRHFEAALERYRPDQRAGFLDRFGHDPEVVCLGRLASTLLLLGDPLAARRARDRTLALAASIDHPFTLGLAYLFAAVLAVDAGEVGDLRALTAELEQLPAETQPVPNLVLRGALAGLVAVYDGRAAEGVAAIEGALDRVRAADPAPGSRALLLRLLVAAQVAAGDRAGGLAAADRALAESGEARLWEPELRRARAGFLSDPAEAAAELNRAREAERRRGTLAERPPGQAPRMHDIERGDRP